MKILISKKEITDKLGKILGVISPKMEILGGVVLNASRDQSYIYATDLEVSVKEKINCSVENEGAACIPARKFYEIVREMSEEMEISFTKKWLEIKEGKTDIKLAVFDIQDYPVWSDQEYFTSMDFQRDFLLTAIEKTIFATGENDVRFALNGLLFHFKSGFLYVVGTDGHRLSMVKSVVPNSVQSEYRLVIPKKPLAILRRFLTEEIDTVSMHISKNHVKFQTDTAEIMVRLLEDKFPNYEAVIPIQNDKIAILDKNEFIKAVKRAAVIGDKMSTYPLILSFDGKNIVEMRCSHPDMGEAKADAFVDYSGSDFTIGFNPKFLFEAVSKANTEKVVMQMSEADKSVYIKDAEDSVLLFYEHILMPVRL